MLRYWEPLDDLIAAHSGYVPNYNIWGYQHHRNPFKDKSMYLGKPRDERWAQYRNYHHWRQLPAVFDPRMHAPVFDFEERSVRNTRGDSPFARGARHSSVTSLNEKVSRRRPSSAGSSSRSSSHCTQRQSHSRAGSSYHGSSNSLLSRTSSGSRVPQLNLIA
eukprot:gnl/MRDRNA2_/MRDRNA2_289082_c0_seq1.p1 gnl/MRDRNA2_/MRDRNA2_289082_c0~~gnl/MRDRNA2_/MRDRNA2_289082_c0_seq1.p1  ORF type:complete len:162 (-),score=5.66 gnl/MRDRNA2_/MRDRNA2_289082_c0_seq1:90-575(-)